MIKAIFVVLGVLLLIIVGLFFLVRAWFRGPNPGPF